MSDHANENIDSRKELIAFISQFPSLNSEEIEAIADKIKVRNFKKGTVLIKAGDIVDTCYFVLKGLLRQYTIVEGIEKTTGFFIEEQAAVFFTSYTNQSKTDSYLVCDEDAVLIIGEPGEETEMYEQFPKLQQITRMMMEQDFGKIQDAMAYFISSSPIERYVNLRNTRPTLLNRVPQRRLASYIGVTPESLSRIRKRLSDTK